MKTTTVNVYIATTQGLVQVQSITGLSDPNLRSVISIDSRADLAGISRGYADFVTPPQGIIQSHFGGNAYRINVSSNIDHGTSWQLGVYVAHYLHAKKVKVDANTDLADTIVIATGEIDTLSLTVKRIQHLSKKCIVANTQIQNWLGQGKKVLFLVPAENYRDPIPDSLIALTPISSLEQLPYLLDVLKVSKRTPEYSEVSPKPAGQENISDPQTVEMLAKTPPTIEENSKSTRDKESIIIDAVEKKRHFWQLFTKPSVIIALGIWLLIGFIIYLGMMLRNDLPVSDLQGLDYRYTAVISENRASCRLATEMAQTFALKKSALSNPYLANLNGGNKEGISQFGNFVQLPSSNLNNICLMSLETSQSIKAVWLLSDSNTLLTINPVVQKDSNLKWSIPLPQNNGQSRQYHLLVFTQSVDAADLQSLSSLLQTQRNNGHTHSIKDLSQWATQLSLSVLFIGHQLNY